MTAVGLPPFPAPALTNGAWRFHLPDGITLGAAPYLIDAGGPQLFGAPDLRRVVRPRPGDHGQLYVGPDLYGGNKIVIPVVILGTSESDALDLLTALSGACAPLASGYTNMAFDGPRGSWQITGRFDPVDAPSLDLVDVGAIQALVSFEASDPRYRSLTVTSLVLQAGVAAGDSGHGYAHGFPHGFAPGTGAAQPSGVVVNAGNATASATITITATGAVLTNPAVTLPASGDVLGFITTVAPGQYLITDTATGIVLLSNDPVDLSGAANRASTLDFPANADMLHFPPGSTQVAFTAAGGQGSCTIAWQDSYLF
jgi:hypothetical protein